MNEAVEAANKSTVKFLSTMIETYRDWHEKFPLPCLPTELSSVPQLSQPLILWFMVQRQSYNGGGNSIITYPLEPELEEA